MLMKLILFFIILAPRELSGCSVSLRELLFNASESADWTAAIPSQTQQPSEEPRYAPILPCTWSSAHCAFYYLFLIAVLIFRLYYVCLILSFCTCWVKCTLFFMSKITTKANRLIKLIRNEDFAWSLKIWINIFLHSWVLKLLTYMLSMSHFILCVLFFSSVKIYPGCGSNVSQKIPVQVHVLPSHNLCMILNFLIRILWTSSTCS